MPGGRAAPGTVIGGRYTLRAAVGHGGMGTVWRAADTLLRRAVAVKEVVLPPGLAPSDRDAMYERTLREARAAAALSHPAVVQVYDVVTEAGRPWIVMELLDARSLADMVIEDGPLNPRAVAKIGIALLGALEVAHAAGVLHRDVKPANVLISVDGRCVLTDFGVARMPTDVQLTTPGMVLGSPHFISPERAMGGEFGPPSDLFSLGVTLYTAVEGRPPFDRGDPIETMHAVVEDPPLPPVRAGSLGNILYGLLEKDPRRRWDGPTCRSLLRELLAGPLASTAPPHQMTDPYAVVPTQRSAPPPYRPPTNGQIGGRAMLAPGESLTDRLAALRRRATRGRRATGNTNTVTAIRPGTGAAAAPPTGAGGPPGATTAGYPVEAGTATQVGAIANPATVVAGHGGATAHSGAAIAGHGGATAHSGAAIAGHHPGTAGRAGTALLAGAVDTARRAGGRALGAARGWPRHTQLAVAGGTAVVLLLSVALLSNLLAGTPAAGEAAPTPSSTVTDRGPGVPVQRFADRGASVNVPQGWRKTVGGLWVDFTDPDGSGRRVRILTENSGAESRRFMEIAENVLRRSRTCAKPYTRVDLREVELNDQPATELEYTCGSGGAMRHGVWRAVVSDGRAYSFYLTAPQERFDESRGIFTEMVNTFELTKAG